MTAKRVLAERGLSEAVTWSFMSSAHIDLFGGVPDELRLLNPISADLDVMRPSILPNLMQAVGRNADRGYADAGLFEVGPHVSAILAAGAGYRRGRRSLRPDGAAPVGAEAAPGRCLRRQG